MTRAELRRVHLYFFALITIIMAVLFTWADLWTDLRRYETQNDEKIMDAFCQRLSEEAEEGNCSALLEESGYRISYFTYKDAGLLLAKAAAGKEITYDQDDKEPSVYSIFAGGDQIASVRMAVSEHYGLLKLPGYSVTSIEGTRSVRYAIKSPSGVYIGKNGIQTLSPVQTNYVLRQLQVLKQSCEEVPVPEYLIYQVSGLFEVPGLSTRSSGEEFFPMNEIEEGFYLVGDVLPAEPDTDLENLSKTMASLYTVHEAGHSQWEYMESHVLASAPVFTRLSNEAAEKEPSSYNVESAEILDMTLLSENLAAVRITTQAHFTYEESAPADVMRDDTFYYYHSAEEERWMLCEIEDNLAKEPGTDLPVKTEKEPLKLN